MKIDTQFLEEDHHAQLTVEVEPERLEAMKRRAAAQIARRIKIPGFRPGKAPYAVILRQVGEEAVLQQAIDLVVDEIYPQVIEQAEIEPYGPGELTNIPSQDPLVLEFRVPLEAQVTLGDYSSIREPYQVPVISDEDVNDVILELRKRQAVVEPVERPAQEGDLVMVKFSAERMQVEEGQESSLIADRSREVIILAEQGTGPAGEEEEDTDNSEWPFPGFSRLLIGMSPGEEKTIQYTYPEDYDVQTLRGVQAEFAIAVESVKSRTLPEVDDEFAVSLGDYANLEALLSDVRTTLEERALSSYNETYDDDILKEGIEQSTIKYPAEMLAREIELGVEEFKRRLGRQGMEFETYLKIRGLDENSFKEEMKPAVEQRIKRELFLAELARAENIQINADDLEKQATETMEYLYQTLPEGETRKLSRKNVYTNIVTNVMVDMMTTRTLEHFRDLCSGKLEQAEAAEQDSAEAPAATSEAAVAETTVEELPASGGDQPAASEESTPEAPGAGDTPAEAVQAAAQETGVGE